MAKILIIDDETSIRRILRALLEEHGHEVAEVASGEEALAKAADWGPDVTLLDLSLPGLDGLATLRQLRAAHPTLDVVMMTAYATIRSAVEAMRAGAVDYLTKPFDNEELLLILKRTLDVRHLSAEVDRLRDELETRYGFNEIIGISPSMQEVFRVMAKVARVDATVLVEGESGTGKELVARAIHRRGARSAGPFVAVNCSAIPEALFESEFFGFEKGAFTGASERRMGKFEQAHGGTLFLDEIGDLASDAQAKLLRALQERQIARLGASRPVEVDVRVIAAANKDLEAAVARGAFRDDLFWRINVVHLKLPPLRNRRADLPLLIDHFLDRFNREMGLSVRSITSDARRLLQEYDWPGNIRELENTVCRAMVLCESDALGADDLPPRVRGESPSAASSAGAAGELSLADAVARAAERVERTMIRARLAECQGNRTATAKSLGIGRKTLFNKMKQYGLSSSAEEEPDE